MKRIRVIWTVALVVAWVVLPLWYWQARYAEALFTVDVPRFIAGCVHVRYSIAIGKSQVHPFWTVWTTTHGQEAIGSFPNY